MQHHSNSGVVENKHIEQFITPTNKKAPSEGRYNKAAVRALLVETILGTVSTSKYPMKGGNEL